MKNSIAKQTQTLAKLTDTSTARTLIIALGVCYCWGAFLHSTKGRDAHLQCSYLDFKLDVAFS